MTDQEHARIRAGFEECNRRMQEYSGDLAKVKDMCGTLVDQVQRLKDAVAMAMVAASNASRPPAVIKELMVGDKVTTAKGQTGVIESVAESFIVKFDHNQRAEAVLSTELKRIK